MKLELRNDSVVACEECGVTEPLLAAGLGTPVEQDLTGLFERAWDRRETELTRLFRDESAAVNREFVAAIEELSGRRARRWRLMKRRWQRQLQCEVDEAVAVLRDETRRV